jgi:hypothetical protein
VFHSAGKLSTQSLCIEIEAGLGQSGWVCYPLWRPAANKYSRLLYSSVIPYHAQAGTHHVSLLDSAIHHARPEIKAAAHCHSLSGKAYSAFGLPIDTLTQDSCLFYDNLSVYNSFGGIVLAQEEGEQIAEALGPKHKACILQNHGLLTRKASLFHLDPGQS